MAELTPKKIELSAEYVLNTTIETVQRCRQAMQE